MSDHLPEYATLMAMGYRLSHLLGVVLREGLYLAALGYIPAYLAGEASIGLCATPRGCRWAWTSPVHSLC